MPYIYLISTLTARDTRNKGARQAWTSLPGGPGEASSAVGVARAGLPAQCATSAQSFRGTIAIIARSAFDGVS
eukprot:3458869-Prymnesium_polylepis.1